jgi:hypothetical protein
MQKIVENYNVGEFITSHEPQHLAEKVKTVLEKEKFLSSSTGNCFKRSLLGK